MKASKSPLKQQDLPLTRTQTKESSKNLEAPKKLLVDAAVNLETVFYESKFPLQESLKFLLQKEISSKECF